jgi:hypothetical protein
LTIPISGADLNASLMVVLVLEGKQAGNLYLMSAAGYEGTGTPGPSAFTKVTYWHMEQNTKFDIEFLKGWSEEVSASNSNWWGLGGSAIHTETKYGTLYGYSALISGGFTPPYTLNYTRSYTWLIGGIKLW